MPPGSSTEAEEEEGEEEEEEEPNGKSSRDQRNPAASAVSPVAWSRLLRASAMINASG